MKLFFITLIFTISADLIGQNRIGNNVLYYLKSFKSQEQIDSIATQIAKFLVLKQSKFQLLLESPLTENQKRKRRQKLRIKAYRKQFLEN